MKSMFSQSIAVAAMLAGSCAATNPLLDSLLARQDINPTYKGCFSSAGSLKLNGTATWQSKKNCYEVCSPLGFSVEATADANACWCGNALPPNADLVSDSQCNLNCTGYPAELCGGANTFSVYLTGVGKLDTDPSSSASPSASSTSSTSPTSVAPGEQTVVVTASSTPSAAAQSSSPNKAAIAAGVVVGLLAFAAAAGGGAFLYLRRRRNRAVEEEYRRNAAVSEFVAGGKGPSHSSNSASYSDNRLDPTVMAQRRMSDGSIADNEDYSRRILKVTNA